MSTQQTYYHYFFILLILLVINSVHAEDDFIISAHPKIVIPTGPELYDGTAYYSTGGGVQIEGTYYPSTLDYLFGGIELDMSVLPINGASNSANFIGLGATLGVKVSPYARLSLNLKGRGGLYMGIIDAGAIRDPYYGAGASITFRSSPGFSFGIESSYSNYLTSQEPVLKAFSFGLTGRYTFGGASKAAALDFTSQLNPIYPLFFSYYEKNPAGKVHIRNEESTKVKDLKVSFYVKQYMDQPKICLQQSELARDERISIPVYALFTEDILRVTEGTKVAGEFKIEYTYIGRRKKESVPVSVEIKNRNAMTWSDDRKAAAFVTAKDPVIMSFAKNVSSTVGSYHSTAVNERFRTAFGIFEALSLYGMGYVKDPNTPYEELSITEDAVDYLQFPNQTIAYKAGDCDDLTVLYAALLESVGVRTALITIPGHIYMAFALDMEKHQAEKIFLDTKDLIIRRDEVWVPVEITLVREGFLKSWQIGAKEWRKSSEEGTAALYPVHDAWNVFEPVGFISGGAGVVMPDRNMLLDRYQKELRSFVNRQIGPRENILKKKIAETNSIRAHNSLGLLYARFGLLDKAAEQFRRVLTYSEYVPAMINLANIHYIKTDMQKALEYYSDANRKSPRNRNVLLGLARTNYELERYEKADEALTLLETEAPKLAEQFAYLASSSTEVTNRASRAIIHEVTTWEEGE